MICSLINFIDKQLGGRHIDERSRLKSAPRDSHPEGRALSLTPTLYNSTQIIFMKTLVRQLIVKQLGAGAQIREAMTEDEYMDTQEEGYWEQSGWWWRRTHQRLILSTL